MEKINSIFNILFSPYGLYIVISTILFFYVSDKKIRINLSNKLVYEKLNANWKRFHIWGKDKTVLKSIESLQQSLFKATGYAIILFVISSFIPFLNFLGLPIILFVAFSLYFFSSCNWVFNHKEEVKNRFSGIITIIILSILTTFAIFTIGIYTSDLNFFNDLGQKIPPNFKETLYITALISSIILLITFTISAYLGMWILFGALPISLILIFFFIFKLSKHYQFFKSKTFENIIYMNFIILTIISLLFLQIN